MLRYLDILFYALIFFFHLEMQYNVKECLEIRSRATKVEAVKMEKKWIQGTFRMSERLDLKTE